jgi:hypothetical protein
MAQQVVRNPAILLALVIGFALAAPNPLGGADESLEYRVKAVFLLNFIKFTEWPPSAFTASDSPISICILGADPFGDSLDQVIAGESVNGKKVTAERLRQAPSAKACQVLFVSKSEKNLDKILPALGQGVLTVGDEETFIRAGGMISFIIEDRRVRFDINQTAAQNAALKLSSKLLSVARSVEK